MNSVSSSVCDAAPPFASAKPSMSATAHCMPRSPCTAATTRLSWLRIGQLHAGEAASVPHLATDLLLSVLLGVGGERSKESIGLLVEAGREVQRVRVSHIERRGWEAQSPQPGDGERVAVGVADLATELAACGFVGI